MSTLIIPPGKKTGCLPRKYGFGEICGLAEEHIDLIPQQEWAGIIEARKAAGVSVRDDIKIVFDQDGVGSCATESTAQGVQTTHVLQGREFVQLNPWFVYHTTSGGSDRGSNIDANLAFVREYGIAPESVWPRSKGWRTKPSAEAYEAAKANTIHEFYDAQSVGDVGSGLLTGFLCVFGWQSHSELMIDLVSPTHGLVVNSWSPQWGDGGFHVVPLASINFGYGCFLIRSTGSSK